MTVNNSSLGLWVFSPAHNKVVWGYIWLLNWQNTPPTTVAVSDFNQPLAQCKLHNQRSCILKKWCSCINLYLFVNVKLMFSCLVVDMDGKFSWITRSSLPFRQVYFGFKSEEWGKPFWITRISISTQELRYLVFRTTQLQLDGLKKTLGWVKEFNSAS